jgi:hypothetical protein
MSKKKRAPITVEKWIIEQKLNDGNYHKVYNTNNDSSFDSKELAIQWLKTNCGMGITENLNNIHPSKFLSCNITYQGLTESFRIVKIIEIRERIVEKTFRNVRTITQKNLDILRREKVTENINSTYFPLLTQGSIIPTHQYLPTMHRP